MVGLGLLIFGSGPLLGIIVLAWLGLWPDTNLNPIGPGLLAALTFWPGIIWLGIEIIRVWRRQNPS